MRTAPKTVDEYLRGLPEAQKGALEDLRRTVKAALPDVEETISYQIPTFKLGGRMLVSYAAFKAHLSFFPGAAPVKAFAKELEGFKTSKGTVQFSPENPLPADLVERMVRARVAERTGT